MDLVRLRVETVVDVKEEDFAIVVVVAVRFAVCNAVDRHPESTNRRTKRRKSKEERRVLASL